MAWPDLAERWLRRRRAIASGGLSRRPARSFALLSAFALPLPLPRALPLALALAFAIAFAGATRAQPPAETPSSASLLTAAFANRYDVDAISRIELVMRDGSGETSSRKLEYVAKRIDGRLHSIARLVAPEYLRGTTILNIEQRDRSHDAFVFLPSLGKARRVGTAQRGDAFFGSDLIYEDLERKRIDEFELGEPELAQRGAEAIYRIGGALVREGIYARIEFDVAQSDGAILETRYYKRGEARPYRVIEAPRSGMLEQAGHVLPTRLLVGDLLRGTSTEVLVTQLRVNPPISDRIFTVATLEQERKLPEP